MRTRGHARKPAARDARPRRLTAAERQRRQSIRLRRLVAAGLAAIAATVVATGGASWPPGSTPTVTTLLNGIPEQGNTLGDPDATVTVTEYGDLTCPVGRDFARGTEALLISSEVARGEAKLVYRGFATTSETANAAEYAASQIAVRAAGRQGLAWYYILLFYDQQHAATTPYVNNTFLEGLAAQIHGLRLDRWRAARHDAALAAAVVADGEAATALGVTGTPAIFVSGPRGTLQFSDPNTAIPTLAQLQSLMARVS